MLLQSTLVAGVEEMLVEEVDALEDAIFDFAGPRKLEYDLILLEVIPEIEPEDVVLLNRLRYLQE